MISGSKVNNASLQQISAINGGRILYAEECGTSVIMLNIVCISMLFFIFFKFWVEVPFTSTIECTNQSILICLLILVLHRLSFSTMCMNMHMHYRFLKNYFRILSLLTRSFSVRIYLMYSYGDSSFFLYLVLFVFAENSS